MALPPIVIRVLGDTAGARRDLESVQSTASKVGGKFRALAGPAAIGLGALVVGSKKAIDSASDLSEEVSKSGVIFGKQADEIGKFAKSAEQNLGQSERQALQAAAGFGQIAQKAGLGGSASAQFAKDFTGLSSDLASFNNTSPEEAIVAISAAMRGESEPIRKYGVLLDDATLRARALKLGLIKTTKDALTPQQKALAASAEIMAQTGKAQGDFARTADGAANKSRILAAQQENLSATLGKQLLPFYERLQKLLSRVLDFVTRNSAAVQIGVAILAGLAAMVLIVNGAMAAAGAAMAVYRGALAATKVVSSALKLSTLQLNLAFLANPVFLIVAGLLALIAAFVIAYKKSDRFRAIVDKTFTAIKTKITAAIQNVLGFVKANWPKILILLTGPLGLLVVAVVKNWDRIKAAARNGVDASVRFISNFRDKILALPDRIMAAFKGAGKWLVTAGREIIQGLLDGIGAMIGKVKDKLGELTDLVPDWKGPPSRDRTLLTGAGRTIIESLVDGFGDRFPAVRRTLADLSTLIGSYETTMAGEVSITARTALLGSAERPFRFEVKLTADELSLLEQGRRATIAIDAYQGAGGRRLA